MMAGTHRTWAAALWLGVLGAADAIAVHSGAPVPFAVPEVALGAALVLPTAGGVFSPDIDRLWAPGMPRRNYSWKGHRGWTHRWWFAGVLVALTVLVLTLGGHPGLVLGYAPVTGWISHLLGDMIFGRLKILGRAHGCGLETGGGLEPPFAWLCTGVTLAGGAALLWSWLP